jgi:enamine deaminase RidA (YjgF/YER057c/UK114 family)
MSRHQAVNPDGLLPPVGFSHAVVPADGHVVHLGGQTGHHADGSLDEGLAAQLEQALRNIATVVAAAGGTTDDVVSMQVYVTDVAAYRASLDELGAAWRAVFGRHYPAIALLGVTELFDPAALVEIVATAVVPDPGRQL